MFGLFGTPETRLISKIERNMIALESAANAGDWQAASGYASRQTRLLVRLQQMDLKEDAERLLAETLAKNGLVRSIGDEQYREWILDQLLRRGLLPM